MSVLGLLKEPQTFFDNMAGFMGSKERVKEGLQHMSYTNGIMTAVIVGPELIPPSEWMRLIVDLSGQQGSIEDAQLVMNLLLLDYDKINASLMTAEKVYKPFFWEDEAGQPVVSDWAEGFWTGVRLRLDAWAPMFNDEEARIALLPILLSLDETKFRPEIERAGLDAQEVLDTAQKSLPKFVQYMHGYWRRRRTDGAGTIRQESKKAGRNKPCPCGSGRKFKKCCLN